MSEKHIRLCSEHYYLRRDSLETADVVALKEQIDPRYPLHQIFSGR